MGARKFDMCIDIMEIWFEIVNGQISSNFEQVFCLGQDNCGVLLFHVLFQSKNTGFSCLFTKNMGTH